MGALGYLAVALLLRGGGSGGDVLQAGLVLLGAGLAVAFSPLVTQALVRVPPSEAADASGVLTTVIQLSQAVGVAVFGSLFLTPAARPGGAGRLGARGVRDAGVDRGDPGLRRAGGGAASAGAAGRGGVIRQREPDARGDASFPDRAIPVQREAARLRLPPRRSLGS